jgi:hypothetical protein
MFKIQEIDPLYYPEFEMMCNDHQTSKPHLLHLQVEFMFPEIKDDLHMLSDNFSIDVNSISSECDVWEKNCAAWILDLPVELLFPEIKYGLLTSADSPSIGNSV